MIACFAIQWSASYRRGNAGRGNAKYGKCRKVELCADIIVSAAAARWSISVGGGGAPPVPKNRRRRGVGDQKHFFLRFTKKFRSILKIFLGTLLVIKALRFPDDQC